MARFKSEPFTLRFNLPAVPGNSIATRAEAARILRAVADRLAQPDPLATDVMTGKTIAVSHSQFWYSLTIPQTDAPPALPVGLDVRHDALGFYVLTAEEAEKEDADGYSAGFDGRMHWLAIEEAREHARASLNEAEG